VATGFIIRPNGTALTASHVIHPGAKLKARLEDGSEYPLEVVSKHGATDIALLRIQGAGVLPAIPLGDS
jgi:S1-C subfamily serine protease